MLITEFDAEFRNLIVILITTADFEGSILIIFFDADLLLSDADFGDSKVIILSGSEFEQFNVIL